MPKEKYPEHAKMRKVSAESEAIGRFIDVGGYTLSQAHKHDAGCFDDDVEDFEAFMDDDKDDDHPLAPCGYRTGSQVPTHKSIERILADYFKIDLKKLEKEKQAMLEEMRNA